MAKNFLEICQYISLMPNSELSTVNGITDVTTEERNAINRALMVIWNEVDNWDFRYKKTTFSTEAGVAEYALPVGAGYIKENGVKIEGNNTPLIYEPNHEVLNPAEGSPTKYYIEGGDIVLYPTPTDIKTVTLKYRNNYPVITATTVEQDFFVNATDVLNITRCEKEFIDCLGHYTNVLLNADPSDEDYTEHSRNYVRALAILKQVDRGAVDNFSSLTF